MTGSWTFHLSHHLDARTIFKPITSPQCVELNGHGAHHHAASNAWAWAQSVDTAEIWYRPNHPPITLTKHAEHNDYSMSGNSTLRQCQRLNARNILTTVCLANNPSAYHIVSMLGHERRSLTRMGYEPSAHLSGSMRGAQWTPYLWQLDSPPITSTQCAEPHSHCTSVSSTLITVTQSVEHLNNCTIDDYIIRLSRRHNARNLVTTLRLAARPSAYHGDTMRGASQWLYNWWLHHPPITSTQCAEPCDYSTSGSSTLRLSHPVASTQCVEPHTNCMAGSSTFRLS